MFLTSTDYSSDNGASALALLILLPIYLLFIVIGYVLTSWFLMRIFDKAGVQGRWRAWVPIYNMMVFVKLGDLSPWWILVLWGGTIVLGWVPVIGWLIGIAAFVYTLLAAWRVGLKLQKEAVWLILYFFLSIVWLGINAFDKSRWNTSVPPAPWAGNFLADKTVWAGIPPQQSSIGYAGAGGAASGGYAPPEGYTQPPQGYGQPPQGYTQPPQGYTQPSQGYQPPAGAGEPPVPPAAPPVVPPSAPGGSSGEDDGPPAAVPLDPDAPRS